MMSARADTPQVRTLLLTDLVDSTQLVEKLGDSAAAELFRAHDRIVLELQQRWRGRLIDRSDGLLLIFERPIDGLGFALDATRSDTFVAQFIDDLFAQCIQLAYVVRRTDHEHIGE